MSDAIYEAPREIALVYRQVGKSHVFTSKSAEGLHIGSSDLGYAFEWAIKGLSAHFTKLYGRPVRYETQMDYSEFETRLLSSDEGIGGGVVFAQLAEAA